MTAASRAFEIDEALDAIEAAIRPFPKAMLFAIADDGHRSPFEQLVACILSIRTLDEVSLVAVRTLFALGTDARAIAALPVDAIERAVASCTFAPAKAAQIKAIAQRVEKEYGGELPCDRDVLLSFRGVGPKCANLALGIACGTPFIGVDIHVHRVTNRWGYVDEPTPEKTLKALEEQLPKKHWVRLNRLLVPFGKHICRGRRPLCSTCPVEPMCEKRGVLS